LIAEKLPLMLLAVVVAGFAVLSQKEWGAISSTSQMPLGFRVANALVSYVTYLRRVFWPDDLAIYYPHPGATLPMWQAALAFALLLLITSGVLLLGRRAGYLAVGWLWFGLSLGPVIGLVQIGGQAMADRYMYPSGVGIFTAAVWGIAAVLDSRQRVATVLGAASIVALAVVAVWQLSFWKDSFTVFSRAIAVTKKNDRAYLYLGCAHYAKGDLHRAHECFLQSLKLQPMQSGGWNNLAAVMRSLGKEAGAMEAYRMALEIDPNVARTHYDYAQLLSKQGKKEEAQVHLQRAVELEPAWVDPYLALKVLKSGK
jgi:tetratricopeptide (TPR) repeat protein